MHGIKDNLEVRYVGALVTAASNTDSNSSRIDMAGYESVLFVCTVTDSVATGVATLTIEQNDADSDTGMAAVTGTGATLTCAVNDDINGKLLMSELRLPSKRYVQAVRTSATANIAYGEIIAILTPLSLPVSQHSTVGDVNYVSN
jgi:hypothetical protein